VLKICVSGRDPALPGFCKWAAHPADGGTALSKTLRAWADGPILVFQHSVRVPFLETYRLFPGKLEDE
jgi:hypothetical protein